MLTPIRILRALWLRFCLADLEFWTRDIAREYRRNGLGEEYLRLLREEAEALRVQIALLQPKRRRVVA